MAKGKDRVATRITERGTLKEVRSAHVLGASLAHAHVIAPDITRAVQLSVISMDAVRFSIQTILINAILCTRNAARKNKKWTRNPAANNRSARPPARFEMQSLLHVLVVCPFLSFPSAHCYTVALEKNTHHKSTESVCGKTCGNDDAEPRKPRLCAGVPAGGRGDRVTVVADKAGRQARRVTGEERVHGEMSE